MNKIEIDISDKILRIECSDCSTVFIESFDDLNVKSSMKCPYCGHEQAFLINIKKIIPRVGLPPTL